MRALFTPGREPASGSIARRFLIAVLAEAAVSGCSRPRQTEDSDIRIDVKVTPQPPMTGKANVEILFRDAQGRPLEAASVKLEGNMSHAGMKPSFATARRDGQGHWLADLELTMGGDWLLIVKADLVDGREVERIIELRGVVSR